MGLKGRSRDNGLRGLKGETGLRGFSRIKELKGSSNRDWAGLKIAREIVRMVAIISWKLPEEGLEQEGPAGLPNLDLGLHRFIAVVLLAAATPPATAQNS